MVYVERYVHTYIHIDYIPYTLPFARFEAFGIVDFVGGIPLLLVLCMVSYPSSVFCAWTRIMIADGSLGSFPTYIPFALFEKRDLWLDIGELPCLDIIAPGWRAQ